MGMPIMDLSGARFGKLVVTEYTGRKTKSGHNLIWLCKCDCGNLTEADSGRLRSGAKKSCGCLAREHARTLNRTHGGRNDRLYLVWMDMRRRCNDEKDISYHNYGGRGIKVCDAWNDYSVFKQWAIENGYDENARKQQCTLDRIDVNGDYEPGNCRWVGCIVQQNNRRDNVMVTHNGKTQSLMMWSRELGVKYDLLEKRMKAGWEFERAITEPSRDLRIHRKSDEK